MARPTICKISDEKFKDYVLNRLVDKNGKRMSIRDLIIDEEFIQVTGYKTSPNSTTGTLTAKMKKLGITERVLYDYHIKSGRIPPHITFEEFELHKTRKGKQLARALNEDENVSEKELQLWDLCAKRLGLVITPRSLGVRGFKEFCYACGLSDEDIARAYNNG